jgi:hypothetical protein
MIMKTKRFPKVLIGVVAGLSIHALSARAAAYKVDWQTVDGGGGDCSGGKLSLSGTVGQPEAGFCAGSAYVQQGGFWPAFQKDVGPPLRMTFAGGMARLRWTSQCSGFHLEGAPGVTGPWSDLGLGTPTGAFREAMPPAGFRFFRLRKDCPK